MKISARSFLDGRLSDNLLVKLLVGIFLVLASVVNVQASVAPQVAAGGFHTVVLKSDGSIWSWGGNSSGQLGDGTIDSRSAPVRLNSLTGITAVSAGNAHTVALRRDGTVWAWGGNGSGQLGNGEIVNSSVPVQVEDPLDPTGFLTGVVAIVAGNSHTVALKNDGTVWAWGGNDFGQLGDGSTASSSVPVQVKDPTNLVTGNLNDVVAIAGTRGNHVVALKNDGTAWAWGQNSAGQIAQDPVSVPYNNYSVQVTGVSGVVAVTAGLNHTLVVSNDATVWGWGDNSYGQLARDPATLSNSSAPIEITPFTGATAVVAGDFHTLALNNDGTALAVGRNDSGQLGDGNSAHLFVPVTVTGLNGVKSLAAGVSHSVALKYDGMVWAWGNNGSGQLGDGTISNTSLAQLVPGLSFIASGVATGRSHTIALKNDGTVWGWGKNLDGQLGNGFTVDSNVPVQATGITGVMAVVAGESHTVALKTDGTVWAWGANDLGQLGNNGVPVGSATPVQVGGLSGIIAIASARSNHTVALKNDGTVWVWGANNVGQLGNNGAPVQSAIPVKLTTISGVTTVSAGLNHTLAMKNDGTVWGWGDNGYGQLGIDPLTLSQSIVPSLVASVAGVTAIDAGDFHTMAIKGDGTSLGVGRNDSGQLGNNSLISTHTPVTVTGLNSTAAVAGGNDHTVAAKGDGTVWTWGGNGSGQLGTGAGGGSSIPVQVTDVAGVVSIAAGYSYSMAEKFDGTVWGWGLNDSGQLGNATNAPAPTPVRTTGIVLNIFSPVTTATPSGGTYTSVQSVALTTDKPGCNIYYTTDGTVPVYPVAGSTQVYAGPITINATTTLNYFARDPQANTEAVKSESYVINLPPVTTASPAAGTYTSVQSVTLSSTAGATIYYTLDGSDPVYPPAGSTQTYSTPISIGASATLKYFGRSAEGTNEAVKSEVYVINLPPVTTAAPVGGTYTSVQSVTLSSTAGATIYYTLDGSEPVYPPSGGTQTYTVPISIGASSTLKYFGRSAEGTNEAVKSESYVINLPPVTTAAPAAGTYTSIQSVTLSSTAGATIYYTIDGSDPVYPPSGGTQTYTVPISIGASSTLKYFGRSAEGTNEAVKSEVYVINLPPVTTASPVGGTYTSIQSVTLSSTAGATIYYTLDGSEPVYPPSGSTQTYSTPISIGASSTLKYFGRSAEGTNEAVKSESYVINLPPVTTAAPVGGTYTAVQSVTLSSTAGATIYYTLDGSDPVYPPAGSTQTYSTPISIGASATLKYFGRSAEGTNEAVKSEVYVINLPPVTTAAPVGGTYTAVQSVTLSSTAGATIYYTIDGSEPVYPPSGSTQTYSTPISIGASATLKYFGRSAEGTNEAVKSESYVINLPPVTTAAPVGGTYTSIQSVTLSSTAGATIYYTIDGSDPVYPPSGGTQTYTVPISIGASSTLKYFGRSAEGTNEAVKSESYVINLPPVTTAAPVGGTYTSIQSVTLSSTAGATIYYTIDGSDPVYPPSGGTQTYTVPISIGASSTLKYFGRSAEGTNEAVKSEVYVINLPPVTTASPVGGTYTSVQSVTLSSTAGATIYYTLDGSEPVYPPSGSTQTYSTPISIGASSTLKYFGRSAEGTNEAVKSESYVINLPPVTTAAPVGGTYTSVQSVTLSSTAGATIYYTIDGSEPVYPPSGSTQTYSAPISITSSSTLKYFGRSAEGTNEAVKSEVYILSHLPLTVVVQGGPGNSVHSTPLPDINCSGTCEQSYSSGTVVTLTPSPAPNDEFVGWSGSCTGNGICSVTMNSAQSVTATFAPIVPSATVPMIAAGYMHTVSLKNDGTVWSWGKNGTGQLGNGSFYTSAIPVMSQISNVVVVAAGDFHTVALKSNGTVWTWGENSDGQLGNNSITPRNIPVQVSNLFGATSIAAGGTHTMAVKNDGTVWGWGNNFDGQLGDNSTVDSKVPVQASGLAGVTSIAAGWTHTVALKGDGTVWAWGDNLYGQAGYPDGSQVLAPAQVAGLTGVKAVAAGGYHTVALKTDGTVWTWGDNEFGQLGNYTYVQSIAPVQVKDPGDATGFLRDVVAISAGGYHTVALKSDGTVWIWGNDSVLAHPNNGTVDSTIPVQVAGVSGVTAISAGGFHSVAMKDDNSVKSWGYNLSGQLGNGYYFDSTIPVSVIVNLDASACFAKVGSTCFGTITHAYLSVPLGGTDTILLQNRIFDEILRFDRDANVTFEGGYDATFASVVGNSILQGSSVEMTAGSVTIAGGVTVTVVP